MSNELKVSYDVVRNSVKAIENSLNSMQADINSNIGSGNTLDTIKKINEMNLMIIQITEQYKKVLKEHNQSVEQSLETLHHVDQILASFMNALSNSGNTVTK